MPTQPHSMTDLDLFMAHLLRCQTVARQAQIELKLTYLYDGAETPHKLVWACALDFWRDNGMRDIPVEHLYSALAQRMDGLPEFADTVSKDAVLQAAYRIYCIPETSLIEQEGFRQLDDFILMRAAGPKLREAMDLGPAGIRNFLSELKKMGVSDTPQVSSESVKPFMMEEVRLGVDPREPCGVTFIDLMLQGGPRPREVYGLLGISGGGKTTLSNQIAVGSAKTKRRAAVFTYEEPLSNEYFIPVYSCASGLPRDTFEKLAKGSKLTDIPDEQRGKVTESMSAINEWAEWFDMSGTGGRGSKGVGEIEAILERRRAEGRPISTVIIDWFWVMVVRYFNRSSNSKFDQERHFAQMMCDELKNLAARQNVWILVNQQLAAAQGGKNKKMGWYDSAELKSFAWYFNGCFVLEPLKDQNIATLHLSKGRSVKTNSMQLQLDGEHATFRAGSGDIIYDKKLNKYVKKGTENNVPVADTDEIPQLISEAEFGGLNG